MRVTTFVLFAVAAVAAVAVSSLVACDRNPTGKTTTTTSGSAVASAVTTTAPAAAAGTTCGANQHFDNVDKKCRAFGDCPDGYHWNEPSRMCVVDQDDSPPPVKAGGGAAAKTKCAANQHFDNINKKCRAFGDCPKGYHWNEPSKMCLMDLEDPPPAPTGGAAAAATKCGENQHYDGISKKCRPEGECPKDYRWNESMKTCINDR